MSRHASPVPGRWNAGLRWSVAGAVVLALHLGLGRLVAGRAMLPRETDAAAPGIMIDLEPVTVPQDQAAPAPAPPAGVPEAAPSNDAKPDEPKPDEPTPTDAPPPEVAPPASESPEPSRPDPAPLPPDPAPAQPPDPAPVSPQPAPVTPTVTLPPTPEPPKPPDDAVLTPPPRPASVAKPKPPMVRAKAAAAQPVRQAEARARREIEERKADREARRDTARIEAAARRTAATEAEARQGADSQERAASSAGAVASWRGELVAHLNRFKRAPADGGAGTARVSFTVDHSGNVIGVRLASSSGDSALDAAAIAMVERANPVPAPPSEMGNRIPLSVPVHFSGS